MRAGYLMHRYLHRLLGERAPQVAYSTDGAEMGKLMVAEGLGVTLLPEFSVLGDPLNAVGSSPAGRSRRTPTPRSGSSSGAGAAPPGAARRVRCTGS